MEKEVRHLWISGRKVFKEKTQCQGPAVRMSPGYSKNSKKTPGSMSGAWEVVGDEDRGKAGQRMEGLILSNSPKRSWLLPIPFYRWGNWGTKKVNNLSKIRNKMLGRVINPKSYYYSGLNTWPQSLWHPSHYEVRSMSLLLESACLWLL